MLEVIVQNADELACPSEGKLDQWAKAVLTSEAISDAEICIKIISATDSQKLNFAYRDKNKPTNILSFPADIPEEFGLGVIGDLAICAELVELEAMTHNIDLEARWAHMVTHGTLHLLGYDHIQESEAQLMESLETELLMSWGYQNPYNPIDLPH